MKDMLIPVGCNELLDFVRPDHASSPEPSRLFLSFNSLTAIWRFILPKNPLSTLERAHTIQATSSFNYSCVSQETRRLIQVFNPYHSTGI
jgi:hypothetical protein